MDWTTEQIAELSRLWNEGLTTAEIGKRLGISKNGVVGKAHRLHLRARPSPIKRGGHHTTRARVARKSETTVTKFRVPKEKPMQPPRATPAAARGEPWTGEVSNKPCEWPIGHPGNADYHTCAEKALVGKPYCGEHCAVAFIKVKAQAS